MNIFENNGIKITIENDDWNVIRLFHEQGFEDLKFRIDKNPSYLRWKRDPEHAFKAIKYWNEKFKININQIKFIKGG
jgi:hypothetical protein